MKDVIRRIATELDYRNEFTTKEAVIYTVLAIVAFVLAACGESIIVNIF